MNKFRQSTKFINIYTILLSQCLAQFFLYLLRHEILSIYQFFFPFFLKMNFNFFCHPSHYSINLQPLLLGKDHRGNLLLTVDLLSSMEIPLEENMQESTLAVESEFLLSQICCCLYLSQPDDSEFTGPLSCLGMRLCCISAHS